MLIEKHEEEVVEHLMRFWERYRLFVIGSFLAVSFFIVAYSYAIQRHHRQLQISAEHYQVVLNALERNEFDSLNYTVQLLQKKFPTSPYASLATMSQVGYFLKQSNLDEAEVNMNWLVANTSIPVVQSFAKLKQAELAYLKGQHKRSQDLLIELKQQNEPVLSSMIDHLTAKNHAQLDEIHEALALYKTLLSTEVSDTDDAFKALLVAEYNYLALAQLS